MDYLPYRRTNHVIHVTIPYQTLLSMKYFVQNFAISVKGDITLFTLIQDGSLCGYMLQFVIAIIMTSDIQLSLIVATKAVVTCITCF